MILPPWRNSTALANMFSSVQDIFDPFLIDIYRQLRTKKFAEWVCTVLFNENNRVVIKFSREKVNKLGRDVLVVSMRSLSRLKSCRVIDKWYLKKKLWETVKFRSTLKCSTISEYNNTKDRAGGGISKNANENSIVSNPVKHLSRSVFAKTVSGF